MNVAQEKRTAYTVEEWQDECERRFGADQMAWAFICPSCGHVATVLDYKKAGAPEGAVAFSCVGRYIPGSRKAFGDDGKGPKTYGKDGPCNYTGGGLFRLSPIYVTFDDGKVGRVFDFAPSPSDKKGV